MYRPCVFLNTCKYCHSDDTWFLFSQENGTECFSKVALMPSCLLRSHLFA